MKIHYFAFLTLTGLYSLKVNAISPPGNDGQAGAYDLTTTSPVIMNGCSNSAQYSTATATGDAPKGACWSNGPNNNVWFKFTATTAYIKIQVKSDGGSLGTLRFAYIGLWDNAMVEKACHNYTTDYGTKEMVFNNCNIGTQYFVAVDNYAGYSGSFTICASNVVDYDFYQGAKELGATGENIMNTCSSGYPYTTAGASADQSSLSGRCWTNGPTYNRWFKFTATTSYIKIQVVAPGSPNIQYSQICLWNNNFSILKSCVNSLTAPAPYGTKEISNATLNIGEVYYIEVDNYSSGGYVGSFNLCVYNVPDYDYYQGAKDIDVEGLRNNCSSGFPYTTAGASADQSSLTGRCWANGPTYNRWFKFVAVTSYIKVQLITSGGANLQYGMLALWHSSFGSPPLNCYNYTPQYGTKEISNVNLTIGQTYYIEVDNYASGGYVGTFNLCISDQADYDYWQGATDVTPLMNTCTDNAFYTTVGGTADKTKPACWTNGPMNNRWFRFTATTSYIRAKVTSDAGGVTGTLQYAQLALWSYSATPTPDVTPIAASCTNYGPQYGTIEVSSNSLTVGNVYYLEVDNYANAGYNGSFKLCVNNGDYDYMEYATQLTDLVNWCSATNAYETIKSTADQSKGGCWTTGPNFNRWFVFKAIGTTATVDVKMAGGAGSMGYPFLAIWNGGNGATPVLGGQVGCATYTGQYTTITASSAVTVGNWYYISVDNYVGYQGNFQLCVNNFVGITYYSASNGNWNNNATWSTVTYGSGTNTGTYPLIGDVALIQGNTVTVNSANAKCAGVTMTFNGTAATGLIVDGNAVGGSLTVNGKLTMNNSGQNQNGNLTVQNAGTLVINNDAIFTKTGGGNTFLVNVTGAGSTMSVGNDMSWVSGTAGTVSCDLTVGSSGSLSVTRDLILTYTAGGRAINHTIDNGTMAVGRDIYFTTSASSTEIITLNNSGLLRVGRNFIRGTGASIFGQLICNSGSTLEFYTSSNAQKFPATSGTAPDGFTLNNVMVTNSFCAACSPPASLVTLEGPASMNGTLTLNSGIVKTTSTNILTLNNGATVASVGSATSTTYVEGPMNCVVAATSATLNFPISKSYLPRPLVLNVNHSDAASVTYTAEVIKSSATALSYTLAGGTNRVSNIRYWKIDRAGASNLTNATVKMFYGVDDDITDADLSKLTLVKDNGSGAWSDVGGGASSLPPGYIGFTNPFTSFSKFSLANKTGGGNGLPIELMDFKAVLVENVVTITWATASEINNDYFTVEKSSDGLAFETLDTIDGTGNSSQLVKYKYTDAKPNSGVSYYRLKQTDFNGEFTYSNTVSINFEGLEIIAFYPNPAEFYIKFLVNASEDMNVIVKVTDITGRQVQGFEKKVLKGITSLDIDISNIGQAVYFLKVFSDNGKYFSQKQFIR